MIKLLKLSRVLIFELDNNRKQHPLKELERILKVLLYQVNLIVVVLHYHS